MCLVARWVVFLPPTWVCPLGLATDQLLLEMVWRKDSEKDWECGSVSTSPKEGEPLSSRACCLVCLFILWLFSFTKTSQIEIRANSEKFFVGRRLFGEKTTLSALGDSMLKQGGWRVGSEGFGLP